MEFKVGNRVKLIDPELDITPGVLAALEEEMGGMLIIRRSCECLHKDDCSDKSKLNCDGNCYRFNGDKYTLVEDASWCNIVNLVEQIIGPQIPKPKKPNLWRRKNTSM